MMMVDSSLATKITKTVNPYNIRIQEQIGIVADAEDDAYTYRKTETSTYLFGFFIFILLAVCMQFAVAPKSFLLWVIPALFLNKSLLHEEVMCVSKFLAVSPSILHHLLECLESKAEGRETNEILKTCCSSSKELNPSFLLPFCCWRKSWLRNEFSSSSRKEKGQFPKKPSSYFNSSSLSLLLSMME